MTLDDPDGRSTPITSPARIGRLAAFASPLTLVAAALVTSPSHWSSGPGRSTRSLSGPSPATRQLVISPEAGASS